MRLDMEFKKIKKILGKYNLADIITYQQMPYGFANQNFKLTTSKGNYLLRINRQKDIRSIKYELTVLEELKKINFPTAYPVARKDGKYITEIDTEKVMIYDFVEGFIPQINTQTVEEIAKTAAKLNSFSNWQKFEKKNAINIDNCFNLIDEFDSAKYKYPQMFEYFVEQTEFLNKCLRSSVPRGLIHADIFPDNTIFKENKLIALIDFEDVCTDDLIFEVGMAINGFCFVNNELNRDLLKTFVQKYNNIRPLTKTELELIPVYIQWTAHGMVSWHLQRLMKHQYERQLVRTIELIERVKLIRKMNKWELL